MNATLYAYPATLSRQKDGRYLVRFPDLPEALTDGASRAEALEEAADCLSEALAARIAGDEAIPIPSALKRGQSQVAPAPAIALKAALHTAMGAQRLTVTALAARLGVDRKEVRRLLDPRHPTKLPRITAALSVLGRQVAVSVYEITERRPPTARIRRPTTRRTTRRTPPRRAAAPRRS